MFRWQKLKKFLTLTVAFISEQTGLSVGTVPTIITQDLVMRKVYAKLMSKILNEEQRHSRVEIWQEILYCAQENKHFLDKVITGCCETGTESFDRANKNCCEWKFC